MNLFLKRSKFFVIFISWILACFLIVLAIGRYDSINSNYFDLGIYQNILFKVDYDNRFAFFGHIQPLILVWSFLYKNLHPEFAIQVLLFLQVLAILLSVILIWHYIGILAGFAMLIYYPLWVNALFDFHFDHLSILILAVFFIFCKKNKFLLAAIFSILLLFVKETFALQVIACGFYLYWLAVRDKKYYSKNVNNNIFNTKNSGVKLALIGTVLIFIGLVWFYLTTFILLPYFSNHRGGIDSDVFSWMGQTPIEMILTLLFHPVHIIKNVILIPEKIKYLVILFGLLGFIPLLRPSALIVALPPILISLLAKEGNPNFYSYANHYTAGIIVPMIIAFDESLSVVRHLVLKIFPSFKKYFFVTLYFFLIIGHWAFSPSPISRLFWSEKVHSYSLKSYIQTDRDIMIKKALLAYIPKDQKVSVSTQNSINWYHLSDRDIYLPFPLGIEKPYQIIDWSNRDISNIWNFIISDNKPSVFVKEYYADYVVLDMKRPYFIVDQGCKWIYGKCRDNGMENLFLEWVSYTKEHYEIIYENDKFIILQKKLLNK